jgi:LPS O-antigen subunit length determinant protein (WzzB/FepE family)
MYAEALKNLELAEFSLRRKEPFIALIDSPIAPIAPQSESKIKAIIIGLLLGGLISGTFIVGRKIYREAMQSP